MIRTIIVLVGLLIIIILVVTIVVINSRPKPVGQRCKTDSDCYKGLACNNDICKKTQNYPCLSDSDCITGSCVKNVCVARVSAQPATSSQDSIKVQAQDSHQVDQIVQPPAEYTITFRGKDLTFRVLANLNAPGIYILYKGDWYRVASGIWSSVSADDDSIIGIAGDDRVIIMKA